MTESILKHFQELEGRKSDALAFLRSKSKEEIAKSMDGGWSLVQVLRHVQMSKEGSLTYMLKNRPLLPRLNLRILFLVYFLRLKFKAPDPIANPPTTSLEELENDWAKTRGRLKEFLEKYPEKWTNKGVYRHPFIGMLNVIDGLKFFNAHIKNHAHQPQRVDKMIS